MKKRIWVWIWVCVRKRAAVGRNSYGHGARAGRQVLVVVADDHQSGKAR